MIRTYIIIQPIYVASSCPASIHERRARRAFIYDCQSVGDPSHTSLAAAAAAVSRVSRGFPIGWWRFSNSQQPRCKSRLPHPPMRTKNGERSQTNFPRLTMHLFYEKSLPLFVHETSTCAGSHDYTPQNTRMGEQQSARGVSPSPPFPLCMHACMMSVELEHTQDMPPEVDPFPNECISVELEYTPDLPPSINTFENNGS